MVILHWLKKILKPQYRKTRYTETEYFPVDGEYYFKDYVDEILTPLVNEIGAFQYGGNYRWYGPWEGHIRKCIVLFLLKGDSAIFEWGYNYDFLPHYESKRLRYYRTEKAVFHQLRDMPKEFVAMTEKKEWGKYLIPRHANDIEQWREKIREVWSVTKPQIEDWYARVNTIETMCEELDRQMEYKHYYALFVPEQQYVKAFLTAYQGDMEEANICIQKTAWYQEMQDEMRVKLIGKLENVLAIMHEDMKGERENEQK